MFDDSGAGTGGGIILPPPENEDSNAPVNTLQINISLAGGSPGSSSLSTGVWIRRTFTDPANGNKVKTTYIPQDPEQIQSFLDLNPDPGEKASWTKLLGDQIPDIDTGTAIVRLADDGIRGVALWVPDDHAQNTVAFHFTGDIPDGEPGVDLKKFRKCMKAQKARRKTYAQAFCECVNQL